MDTLDVSGYTAGVRRLTGHVVLGIDDPDKAVRALDCAVKEARRRRVPLEVVHGWPWTRHRMPPSAPADDSEISLLEGARRVLLAAVVRVHDLAPELTVVPVLSAEPAAIELVRRGATAGLTVVGTRGRGGFSGLLLGSVSLRVAAHARGPLLVVRGEEMPPAYRDEGHGKVLVGVQGEQDAEAARFAFEEAQRRGARLRVLHAWTYPLLPAPGRPASTAALREDVDRRARSEVSVALRAVADLREKFPDVRVNVSSVRGGPAHALVEASRAADVVVIAARRPAMPFGMQLGPVAHALLHHAHCPVTLVPVDS